MGVKYAAAKVGMVMRLILPGNAAESVRAACFKDPSLPASKTEPGVHEDVQSTGARRTFTCPPFRNAPITVKTRHEFQRERQLPENRSFEGTRCRKSLGR